MLYYSPLKDADGQITAVSFRLYAVSEEDARKMAVAFVELADSRAHARLEQAEKDLAGTKARVPELEKQLAGLQQQQTTGTRELNELTKIVQYGGPDEARKDMVDLDKSLRALEIERVGIQAKIDAINRIGAERREWLDQLRATQDIDMASVLARKSELERSRKSAQRSWQLYGLRGALEYSINRATSELSDARKRLSSLEITLAQLPDYMKPLTVMDNKVLIYRVDPAATARPETQPASVPSGTQPVRAPDRRAGRRR